MTVEITNPKQKDGAEHPSITLQAVVHKLPIIGEDGEQETSLVLTDPTAAMIASHVARGRRTEEAVMIAQAAKEERARVEDRIHDEVLRMLTGRAPMRQIEARTEQMAREAGMPELAKSRTTIHRIKKENRL